MAVLGQSSPYAPRGYLGTTYTPERRERMTTVRLKGGPADRFRLQVPLRALSYFITPVEDGLGERDEIHRYVRDTAKTMKHVTW